MNDKSVCLKSDNLKSSLRQDNNDIHEKFRQTETLITKRKL